MTTVAQHRIQRLVVELHGCDAAQAAPLQAALRNVLQRDWLPVIDQLCARQDGGHQVLRIARLQVALPPLPARAWLDAARGGSEAVAGPVAAAPAADAGHRGDGPGDRWASGAPGPDDPDAGGAPLARALAAALAAPLADAVAAAETVDSAHELLAHALHGGWLPWWADPADRAQPARAAAALLTRPARVWRQLLGTADADAPALHRLAALLDDAQRARLLARLWADRPEAAGDADGASPGRAPAGAPAPSAEPGWPAAADAAWQAALGLAAQAQGRSARRLRSAWWCLAVATALRQGPAPVAGWLPGVLDRLAVVQGLEPSRWRAELRRALDQAAAAQAAAADLLAPLWAALAAGATPPTVTTGPGPGADAGDRSRVVPGARPAGASARLGPGGAPSDDARWPAALHRLAATATDGARWAPLATGWSDLPAPLRAGLRAGLRAAFGALAGHGAGGPSAAAPRSGPPAPQRAAERAFAAALDWLATAGPPAHRAAARAAAGAGLPAAALQRAARVLAEVPEAAPTEAAVAASAAVGQGLLAAGPANASPPAPRPWPDALPVGNAGLVLLWPFLPRFTERLGLRADGRWCDDEAPWQAVRLLQCLASGDRDPPEALLPLNKLLCGLPPDALMPAAEPLADAQAAACEDLLRAVVAQAGVLGELSADGLRGSFLLRRGQLGHRDGHALLQVEPQPWDLLLARLPWGTGIVRLPWMASLLQVDW